MPQISKKKEKRVCIRPECGATYEITRSWQKYCSPKCQALHYNSIHDIAGHLRTLRAQRKEDEHKLANSQRNDPKPTRK